ncbi:MAG TPA: hypothetical protein VK524_07225 [Polyangiaceae bacterium]|nr:hypothetical protein [Polyangiaceae bacterium]
MKARFTDLAPVLLVLGACSTNAASTDSQHSSQAADSQTSLEEDFSYPGADAILEQQKVRLLKGDGNLLLVNCNDFPDSIKAFSSDQPHPAIPYCFSVRGQGGYLTLQMTRFYFLDNYSSKSISVTVNQGGSLLSRSVGPNDMDGFGSSDANGKGPANLVELRAFTP